MRVRVLSHGPMRGKYNMAVDEAILDAYRKGQVGPTLRFYRWKPACLSLGRFQDAEREVDFQRMRESGVDVVRRLTGGKSVLHDDELTYSIVISEALLKGSILETYKILSAALVKGLRALGIPAELSALEHGVTARDDRFKQAACFTAPSWYEITALGKKIVGSAQVRKDGIILQHGSIPLTMDYKKLTDCMKTRSDEHKRRVESMLSRKAAGLSQIGGRSIDGARLEKHLFEAFELSFDWILEKGTLTSEEIREAVLLSQNKYGVDAWTLERKRS